MAQWMPLALWAFHRLMDDGRLRHGLMLVTANTGEFSRVEGLHWQDWTA